MKYLIIKRSLSCIVFLFITDLAYANCINPLITPTECDFKNEDTHLIGYQTGVNFAKEDRVEELITQGESFIENYYANVKTTGDAAQRFMIAPTAAAMTVVEVQQAINTAAILANDPLQLKTIYTDILCEIYWTAQEVITGINRNCPTTGQLLTDVQQLVELDRVRQEITDIVINPNLVLGEQWTDAIDDVQATRARLQSLDTFGRNIALPDMNAFYDDRYPDLAALVAAPNLNWQQSRDLVGELNTSRRNTIREHMMATHQNHLNLRNNDQPELEALSNMSERAVGRMQAIEINNMLLMQGVQNKQVMAEEIMNQNSLIMQDMADSHGTQTRKRAIAIKAATPIPFHEAVLNNGRVFTP